MLTLYISTHVTAPCHRVWVMHPCQTACADLLPERLQSPQHKLYKVHQLWVSSLCRACLNIAIVCTAHTMLIGPHNVQCTKYSYVYNILTSALMFIRAMYVYITLPHMRTMLRRNGKRKVGSCYTHITRTQSLPLLSNTRTCTHTSCPLYQLVLLYRWQLQWKGHLHKLKGTSPSHMRVDCTYHILTVLHSQHSQHSQHKSLYKLY